jgi:hypothetical protein
MTKGLKVAANSIGELAHLHRRGKESCDSVLEDRSTDDYEEAELEIWMRVLGSHRERSDSLKARLPCCW